VVVVEVIEGSEQVYKRASAAGWIPSGSGFLNDENVNQLIASERAAAEHHVEAIRAELQRAGVTDVECQIVSGPPGPAILDAARAARCDTIVLATHGRSGIARMLLGSVAEYIVRNAPCAVVVAPTSHRHSAAGARQS
jgi:nucleotide-binding universal stress UspA family protein